MLEYIYVCRHGFRSNWVDPTIKTGPTGLQRDPPLAVYGLEQAELLAGFLADPTRTAPAPTPEAVYSSPFYRCIQTCEPTARRLGVGGVKLEHGVMEWYSPVNPSTGLHPRPGPPAQLAPLFPGLIDETYASTVFPSRRGESLRALQDRADLFAEAWTARLEAESERVRCVVVFAHAASVIAIGRALTGDKSLNVVAGCASTSLYRRRIPPPGAGSSPPPSGVGQWDIVWNGRADYLPNGVERDWSFRDAVIKDGEVVNDDGDHRPHDDADALPEGLGPGMDVFLRRGPPPPNTATGEVDADAGKGTGADASMAATGALAKI
ncbi:hypothetical protein Q5752_006069 [Cryptotrichosporon argae]